MSNLRVIYNNVADRATISASTTSGSLAATNMQTDFKGQVHRSTGTTVQYSLTWASNQTIGAVVLPCTNLSSSATILVQAYSDTAFTTLLNTGAPTIAACPGTSLAEWQASGTAAASLNANLFPYGGLSKTSYWLPQQYTTVRSLRITLTDNNPANPAGYIDCARIICGAYWQPVYGADRSGLVVSVVDSSSVDRTDNGDLIAEQGFVFDELSFNLSVLADTDRDTLIDIMRRYGTTKNIAVSIFPNTTNSKTEQIYTIYGKRENSSIEYVLPGFNSYQEKIIGW
jgi:hypothetical protein